MTWLEILRQRYATHRARIEEIQQRAISDGQRELTEDEVRQVTEAGEAAAALVPQIEAEAARVEQVRSVDAMAARVAADATATPSQDAERVTGTGEHARVATQGERVGGGAQTQDRDPGHYRKAGEHSFFSDLVRAREGDGEAARRLDEHNRALSTGVAGAGIVPPQWLVSEYEALARQGRVVSAGVRRIELTNPSPLTLPRQMAGTDSVIAEQSTENTHPSETDAFATTTDVVTPKPTSGIQVVSRQMVDMSNPAVDVLIYGDMLAVYNRKVEDKVTAALVAAAGSANTTFATEAAFSTSQAASDAVVDGAIAVWNARKLPATSVAMRVSRWGKFSKMRDTAGRKIYPLDSAGPQNVDGVGSVTAAGVVEGLPVLATDGLGIGGATYPENILVYRASDTILFEGAMQRFRFEEVAGPESVKLGIWAYTAVIVRQAANSVRRIQITAAS